MVRSKPGLINCFRLAGVVKILETLAIFTCLMMHRIGAIGTQVHRLCCKVGCAVQCTLM